MLDDLDLGWDEDRGETRRILTSWWTIWIWAGTRTEARRDVFKRRSRRSGSGLGRGPRRDETHFNVVVDDLDLGWDEDRGETRRGAGLD